MTHSDEFLLVHLFLCGLGALRVRSLLHGSGLVPRQYFKKLEGPDDLWEVRAEFGGDAFRLLGFWDAGRLIILTNGFAKKAQKTPAREMELAAQRKREYVNRKAKR